MDAVTLRGDQDNTDPCAVFIGGSVHIQFPSRDLVTLLLGILGVSSAFRDEVSEGLSFDGCSGVERYVELTQFDGPLQQSSRGLGPLQDLFSG